MAAAPDTQDPILPPEPQGLVRVRLMQRLTDPGSYHVGRVVAPAGSGKSRLLAHVARAYPGPVAWCGTPDPPPRTGAALAALLWRSVAPTLPAERTVTDGAGAPFPEDGTIDALMRSLGNGTPPVLVVIDDIHLIEGSDAEVALSDLVQRVPAGMRLLLASRVKLGLDLSRLRVSGQLVEIGPDDLRFRTWEVEELFRHVYRDPLLPEDVAALAWRTGGWAAYLQLFYLATARKPQVERRRVLASLATRSRLVQEYLGRHVLAELSPGLQDFLVRTSVLRRPTPALCDELLGRDGSAELLAELERRQLFTERIDDDSYRYHTVLLSYLDAKLVETVGISEAREEHHRAAVLLEREGYLEDALPAFAKSEDWVGVARLLGHADGSVAGLGDAWLEALPPTVVESDSLLLMARARRALAGGTLTDAVRIMRDAENVAASSVVAERCRREREQIAAWALPDRPTSSDWVMLLRAATQRDPVEVRARAAAVPGVYGRFVEGAASFLAGDFRTATRALRAVASHPDAPPAMSVGAMLLAFVTGTVSGRVPSVDEIDRLREEVEAAGIPWLERIARVALVPAGRYTDDVLNDFLEACDREGDRWGAALVSLVEGTGWLREGAWSTPALESAARHFSELGAGVLEATTLAYLAATAAAAGNRDVATRAAQQARTLGSLVEAPIAVGLAAAALGRLNCDGRQAGRAWEVLEPLGIWEWHRRLVEAEPVGVSATGMQSSNGVAVGSNGSNGGANGSNGGVAVGSNGSNGSNGAATESNGGVAVGSNGAAANASNGGGADGSVGSTVSTAESVVEPNLSEDAGHTAPVQLRCLGSFSLIIDGRAIDESAAKPMERALLHLLATRPGERVHREALIEALWPEADPDAGLHRLQVAVSALRRLLSEAAGDTRLLSRDAESYRLALPEGSDVDLWRLDRGLRRATEARAVADRAAEAEALAAVIAAYGGPLLPGDGPADWLVGQRSTLTSAATDAAIRLAWLRLENGDAQGAAEAARGGLAVDRYRDELWKLLIEAAERSGHHAEAGRARRDYAAVLDELGV